MKVKLIIPVALEEGVRFAIREGGRTVGAGVLTKVIAWTLCFPRGELKMAKPVLITAQAAQQPQWQNLAIFQQQRDLQPSKGWGGVDDVDTSAGGGGADPAGLSFASQHT